MSKKAMNYYMTPAQFDIRWFYWRMGQAGHAKPSSVDAQAFAERVAIMMADAGMSEDGARHESIKPYLTEIK